MTLTKTDAARLAGIALGHVAREYPHKLDHMRGRDADAHIFTPATGSDRSDGKIAHLAGLNGGAQAGPR